MSIPKPTPRLYFTCGGTADADLGLLADHIKSRRDETTLMLSFFYRYRLFEIEQLGAPWALDSGAFSAWTRGAKIDLNEFIDFAQLVQPQPFEVYALDVIGDWEASLRNTQEMWRQGVEAIPTFHFGEPEDALVCMARDYPKIALGGIARIAGQTLLRGWIQGCFDRVWPKRIHGFALCRPLLLDKYPFESADSASWCVAPFTYGHWSGFGQLRSRAWDRRDLRGEVEHRLVLQRQLQIRWRKEMEVLNAR